MSNQRISASLAYLFFWRAFRITQMRALQTLVKHKEKIQ